MVIKRKKIGKKIIVAIIVRMEWFVGDFDLEGYKNYMKREQEEARKKIFKFIKYHYFNYHEDFLDELEMGFTCQCGEVRDTITGFYLHYEEDEYLCLNCRDELEEDNRFDICSECYNRNNHCSKCDGCKCDGCEC